MRIGLFQFIPEFGKIDKNTAFIKDSLKDAHADLIVLPELATSGYLFTTGEEVSNAAEPVPGPSTESLSELTEKLKCHIVIGIPELSDGKIYNSAVLIGPEGVVGSYRKIHLFDREKEFFAAGNRGFPIFQIGDVKIGLLVCFDHLFPEAARTLSLQGAQVICHPSNLVLPEYGQLTTRVRSIENRIFWILANRHGTEERGGKKLIYTGCSQITAPSGEVLATASAKGDELLTIDIDPGEANDKKITSRNDLFSDRNVSAYLL